MLKSNKKIRKRSCINEYKIYVERKYIITDTQIILPTDNKRTFERIKVSLEAIGLKGIKLDENEIIEYFEFDKNKVFDMIKNGEINDAKTICGLMRAFKL